MISNLIVFPSLHQKKRGGGNVRTKTELILSVLTESDFIALTEFSGGIARL